jgi:glyoxylase-like metal-dependent hydrolase (beta-lactamase superfamily II)
MGDVLEPMSERLEVSIQHLREHGCPADVAWSLAKKQHRVTSHIGPLPAVLERVSSGETVSLGGRQWEVIVTGGHAPEHMSLHSAEAGVLIAGDHLLPRITPVIGIYAEMPDANPLQDYLASLASFRRLADDVLVLPSHGEPYVGVHQRLDDLARHHEDRLATLIKLVDRPISAYEAAQRLFPHGFARGEDALALAETLAHLRYLEARREILRRRTKGVAEFHHFG